MKRRSKQEEEVLIYWLITYGVRDVDVGPGGTYHSALPEPMDSYELELSMDKFIIGKEGTTRRLSQKALDYIREEMGHDTSTT
jgi:hypothetical protein